MVDSTEQCPCYCHTKYPRLAPLCICEAFIAEAKGYTEKLVATGDYTPAEAEALAVRVVNFESPRPPDGPGGAPA